MRGLSLVAASGGHSSSRCAGLSLSRPLLLRSTGSRRAGAVVAAHEPSCSAACGIFPDQGSNPCPLHWQADSQPLRHQGSPCPVIFVHVVPSAIRCSFPGYLLDSLLNSRTCARTIKLQEASPLAPWMSHHINLTEFPSICITIFKEAQEAHVITRRNHLSLGLNRIQPGSSVITHITARLSILPSVQRSSNPVSHTPEKSADDF